MRTLIPAETTARAKPLGRGGRVLGFGLTRRALLLLFGGLLTYVTHEKRKYDKLTDTHDLKLRASKMGEGYVADRSNAALVIGLTQRGKRAVLGFGHVSATNAARGRRGF